MLLEQSTLQLFSSSLHDLSSAGVMCLVHVLFICEILRFYFPLVYQIIETLISVFKINDRKANVLNNSRDAVPFQEKQSHFLDDKKIRCSGDDILDLLARGYNKYRFVTESFLTRNNLNVKYDQNSVANKPTSVNHNNRPNTPSGFRSKVRSNKIRKSVKPKTSVNGNDRNLDDDFFSENFEDDIDNIISAKLSLHSNTKCR